MNTKTLNLKHLEDQIIRQHMLSEYELDHNTKGVYLSSIFNEAGKATYPFLLPEAIKNHDALWLTEQLLKDNYFISGSYNKNGVWKTTNREADAKRLAETEFNKFYIRGVCLYAIEHEIENVAVYRAKYSEVPRATSEAKIGSKLNPTELLEDLRTHQGEVTPTILPDVNSGLSVMLELI